MSERIYVGTRKGLFTLDRRANGWKITHVAFLGVQVPIVLPDARDHRLYAALSHGHFGNKLQRSSDGGQTWTEVQPPSYPPKPKDAPTIKCPIRNIEIPWNVELIWSLATDRTADAALWCGTIPGGLFHSSDGGESWELVRSLWDHPARAQWFGGGYDYPGIHSVLVDPRDANRVVVGVSCGGVWITEDAGRTWNLRASGMRAAYMPPDQANDPGIQDPHILVQCRSNPDVMWAQHHNGIFRTTNGAETWHEIENVQPSAFGFAAAVHPHQPDTAWFVPAVSDEMRVPVDGKVVVTRTTNGGKSFDVLTRGLPQDHAYDLVFRHALDLDETGQRLAMGSTTGGLWISEDGGDCWQTISANLPPVFVVRFADAVS